MKEVQVWTTEPLSAESTCATSDSCCNAGSHTVCAGTVEAGSLNPQGYKWQGHCVDWYSFKPLCAGSTTITISEELERIQTVGTNITSKNPQRRFHALLVISGLCVFPSFICKYAFLYRWNLRHIPGKHVKFDPKHAFCVPKINQRF